MTFSRLYSVLEMGNTGDSGARENDSESEHESESEEDMHVICTDNSRLSHTHTILSMTGWHGVLVKELPYLISKSLSLEICSVEMYVMSVCERLCIFSTCFKYNNRRDTVFYAIFHVCFFEM